MIAYCGVLKIRSVIRSFPSVYYFYQGITLSLQEVCPGMPRTVPGCPRISYASIHMYTVLHISYSA